MTFADVPWWLGDGRDIAWLDPTTGEAEPLPLDPPSGTGGFTGEGEVIKGEFNTMYHDIATPVTDVVSGVPKIASWVSGWFSDPSSPAPPPEPPITPADTANVPAEDPPQTYTGPGASPSWADVWAWQVNTTIAQTPDLNSSAPTIGIQTQRAINVSAGQTIKALSGFINQAVNLQTLASAELANRITDTQNVIGALNNNQALTNLQVANVLSLIVNGALPHIWTEIENTQAQIINEARGVIHLLQVWATDNIHTPLEEQLGQEKTDRIAEVDQLKLQLPDIIKGVVDGLGLAAASEVTSLASQVATLAQENTDCVEPMCETQGPNTNVGKLLKALNLAADAAFLAEILAMSPADLAAWFGTIAAHFHGLVTEFETYFSSKTEKLSDIVTPVLGAAL